MALLWPWIPMPYRRCCPALLGTVPWAGALFDWDVIFSPLSSESSLLFPLIKCLLSLALLAQKVSATSSVLACTSARDRKESFCLSDSVRLVQIPKCVLLSFFPHCSHCALQLTPVVGIGSGLLGLSSTCSGCKAFWSRTITCHSKRTALHTATCAAGWQPLDMLLKSDFHLIFYSKSLCTETQVEKKYRAKNLRKSTASIPSLAHP